MTDAPPRRKPLIQRVPMRAFRDHAGACDACRRVDLGRPATLVLACLEGSRMVKDAGNAIHHADRITRQRERQREGRAG